MIRKTKIIATIGPKSNSGLSIKNLIQAGVDVFRVNLSHGDKETHKNTINLIKKIRTELNKPVSIMLDTRGPEIRVKKFKDDKIKLKSGNLFILTTDEILGDNTQVSISPANAVSQIKVGTIVLANDGVIKLKVIDKNKTQLITKVIFGGELSNNKSISFVNQMIQQEYLNVKDVEDLQYLLPLGIDYISASFVSNKQDILDLQNIVNKIDKNIKYIAKIENTSGIHNIDQILDVVDGIMVARGDLGVETPYEKLPQIQKLLINKAKKKGKISIVATEMLESMVTKIRPTRAEISDVASAVYDGADVVMLSAETAVGINPVNCVKTMSKIAVTAEKDINYSQEFELQTDKTDNFYDLIGQSAIRASFNLNFKAIAIYTNTGKSVGKFCKFSCKVPILAITDNTKSYNQLSMYKNCVPIFCKYKTDIFSQAKELAVKSNLASDGDNIIIITGSSDVISYCFKIETI